jgi:hypothetical protein
MVHDITTDAATHVSSHIMPSSSLNIVPPLQKHPDKRHISNDNGPSQRLSPPRRLENEPFRYEMPPRDRITPHRELVHRRVMDVVSGIQPYHRRQKRPGAKRSTREGRDMFRCRGRRVDRRGIVHARCEVERRVGLDTVTDGDNG